MFNEYDHEWLAALERLNAPKYDLVGKMSSFMHQLKLLGRLEFTSFTDQDYDQAYREITYLMWNNTIYPHKIDIRWSDLKHFIEVTRPNKNESRAKSFAKYLKQNYDYKLEGDLKSRIGNYFKLPDKREIKVVFSMGCEGSSEEYYHSNSCYWGSFSTSRDMIESNEGGAIRMYDTLTEEIISRCWFVPYDGEDLTNGIIIFNAYGQNELGNIDMQAKLIAPILGADIQQTSAYFEYDHTDDELIYLNSHHTYFIGVVWDKYNRARTYINFNTPTVWKYGDPDEGEYCECCGTGGHSEDDMYYIEYHGYSVCDSCLHREYSYVSSLDEYMPDDQVVEIRHNGHWRTFWIEDDDLLIIDGEYYHYEDCVCDENGRWYAPDSDEWVQVESGEIYPREDCEYNEETKEWDYVG